MSVVQPRPGILDLHPYVGGESSLPGFGRIIKLASNESAFGPSPRAVEAMQAALATCHRYPDGGSTRLRQALAERHGLEPARIVCGAGSDELINLLCHAYAGPGDQVLYSRHGFLMFPIAARGAGAAPVAAPEQNLTTDIDALLAHVTPATRLVFIANPNNPTGTYLSEDAVARLHDRLPPDVLLVIDAAYAEFANRDNYAPGFELVEAFDNVVVTRTFSKLYGLGGVRLGWAYASAAVADVLNRLRMPFSVSSLAQAAGLAALEDDAFTARACDHAILWRARLTQAMRGRGFEVPDSQGNFVLVRFPGGAAEAEAVDRHLRASGIIVRVMRSYHLPEALRVSIGAEDEMEAFLAAMATLPERSA